MNFSSKKIYLLNMRKSYRTLAATAVLGFGLGLSACSDDTKTAGGGPSGTEAGNAIMAQILVADAKPAAQARVKIIDSESIDGSKGAYTAVADENGKVIVENVKEGSYTLEATLEGKAVQVDVEVNGNDVDLGSAKLGETATVSGKVNGESGFVKARGMDHSAKVVDGTFSMDSLPAGPLSLVFIPEKGETSSTYLKTEVGAKTTASTFAGEGDYLLLDDFQDENLQNRFMPAHVYDGGWWYFDYDSVSVIPLSGKHHPILEKDENGNVSAHVGATFGDSYENADGQGRWPWAVIGVELGKSDKKLCNDISSVDSVAFMAKGSGGIIFTIIDESLGTEQKEIINHRFSLSAEWTRYSVPIKDVSGNSLTCVNQLAWKFAAPANSETDLWLDDIQLVGGDRLSIWEK